MTERSTILRRTSSVRFRHVGGEGVIAHQEAGEIMAVNDTGALVFELADGVRSLEIIAAAVAERYPQQDMDQILSDVLAFADQLVEAKALERAEDD